MSLREWACSCVQGSWSTTRGRPLRVLIHYTHLFTQVALKDGAVPLYFWSIPTHRPLFSSCSSFTRKKEHSLLALCLLLHLYSLVPSLGIEQLPGPVQDHCSVCGSCKHAGWVAFIYTVWTMVPLNWNSFHCTLPMAGTVEPPNMLCSDPTCSTHSRVRLFDNGVHSVTDPLHRTSFSCLDKQRRSRIWLRGGGGGSCSLIAMAYNTDTLNCRTLFTSSRCWSPI